ncbi:MAG: VWA domain-containing protein, partial [Spirochaetaceae bacterium]|nr:VWA domain-containing protein [Spirochaetaceae bacterium]
MRCKLFPAFLFFITLNLCAQDLTILDNDLLVSQGADGGFHLYIRKKPGISSVLLTETTKDPSLQEDNYAYRASAWNPINGDEYRVIDGALIPKTDNIWSLIDSTPEYIPELGEVFHIYIPYLLNFGYDWSRHGEVYVGDGTYLNVRTFELPYGDYRGGFKDNPFLLRIIQEELVGMPEDSFMKDAVDAYQEIAGVTGGTLYRSTGPENIVKTIQDILESKRGISLDLVFCIDSTASMKNDIEALKKDLVSILNDQKDRFRSFRAGMILYKDYFDEYVTSVVPFTSDMKIFQRNLNRIRTSGGRDIPEAVHEALYEAAVKFPWQAGERLVILIGDAPPHPRPRGKIT